MNSYPDPSFMVQQDVLPHLHLVSSWRRYPAKMRLEINEVIRWLREAPQIARDRAAFSWIYLDRVSDGTTLLMWQPLQRRGITFSSDGFIWNGPEQLYSQEVGDGLTLEMYCHKSGFAPGIREPVTLHSRRRFRLVTTAPSPANPGLADPGLWIVHWGMSDSVDRIPSHLVPIDERAAHEMRVRDALLQFELPRKEFMLSDHVNWPTISRDPNMQGGARLAVPPVPQHVAYPPAPHPAHPAAPGPPARRPRPSNAGSQQPQPGAPDPAFNDEEDNWRGDFFDHTSPREIAFDRFRINHQWMEQVLMSPYTFGQIAVPDLGLGLAGELGTLTKGIFEAPKQGPATDKPYIGKLDAGLADEFRKRVADHIAATEAEIRRMRETHEQRLAEFTSHGKLRTAEQALRGVGGSPSATDEIADGHGGPVPGVEYVLAQVEEYLGKKIELRPDVDRVQAGGYTASVPVPFQPQAPQATVTGGGGGGGAQHYPPHPGGDSYVHMGGALVPPQSVATAPAGGGEPTHPYAATPLTAPDHGTGSGEWVVVPKGGATPDLTNGSSAPFHPSYASAGLVRVDSMPQPPPGPPGGLPPPLQPSHPPPSGGMSFGGTAFGTLGALDSTGDVLDGLDMDGSAFGEAFAGVNADGQGPDM